MQNYLMLNGKQINLTEEQINSIKQSFNTGDVLLSTLKPAETFKIGKYEFFMLEQFGDSAVVLLKDLLQDDVEFSDNNNNYDGSNVDNICTEFGTVIENIIGADNLVEHTVDLTSDDGLKCYGSVNRKMSLLTAEQYRKYVYTIDEHKLNKWWWTATAYSTPKHEDKSWIKCVSPGGFMGNDYCNYGIGVRPFCILKSNIFVSK